MAIQISQEYLELIKSALAYPVVDMLVLTDEQVKQFCISRAMRNYFTKFPLKETFETTIRDQVTIDFPNENVFGVLDARVVDSGMLSGSGNSFWDVVFFNQMSGGVKLSNSSGAYGVKGYNPSGALQMRDQQRQAIKSHQNNYHTVKFNLDLENKKLTAYSNISGKLNITWAKQSENFSAIKYTYIDDVITLCQAYLLEHFANTVGMITDNSLETSVNADTIREEAEKKKDKIFEKWAETPDVLLIHFFG